jgi:long-chain acyl-CoA synthetase
LRRPSHRGGSVLDLRDRQKLRAELETRFDSSPDDVRADLQEGLRLGVELDDAHSQGRSLAPAVEARWRVLDARLFAPIRAAVGLDQAVQLVSSAAPIDRDTLTFHTGIGLHIYEAYGLTEASGGISINPPGRRRSGTVGTALPTLEVALAEDGELLARGPTMMAGYRHNDAATSEAIDRDGWLHTGDIATIDGDGYITIIDRKKDLIINAAGKNMSPAN